MAGPDPASAKAGDRDWVAWHAAYDVDDSLLRRRLEVVQARVRDALDAAPPGTVRCVSMCAGQARDIVGVLADHPRRADVVGRLVELDAANVRYARRSLSQARARGVEVVQGDAGLLGAYDGAVPADLVLACGVFGNIDDADIARTVAHLPQLCARGATVVWTRHRKDPDLTPTIRGWFADAGFVEVAFDAPEGTSFGVGTHRFDGEPQPLAPTSRLFRFLV
jgi:hypothetical protein